MPTASRKKAHIVSSFTDSGTGESFTAGEQPMIDAGAFANYEAAGLVRHPPVATKAAASKRRSSRTAKGSASVAPAPSATRDAVAPESATTGA